MIAALALFLTGSADGIADPIRVKNGKFIDTSGREVFFRGVNVVYKDPPYLPTVPSFHANLSFVEDDVKLLASVGVNVRQTPTNTIGRGFETHFTETSFPAATAPPPRRHVARRLSYVPARLDIYVLFFSLRLSTCPQPLVPAGRRETNPTLRIFDR